MGRICVFSVLFFCVIICFSVNAANIEDTKVSDKYVNDFANVISAKDKYEIVKLFKRLKQENVSAELVTVYAVRDYLKVSDSVDYFAHSLLKRINGGECVNSRVLILLSVYDRECRIIADATLEAEYRKIFHNIVLYRMIPYFIAGEYSKGIYEGCSSVTDVMMKSDSGIRGSVGLEILLGVFVFVSVLLVVLFFYYNKKRDLIPVFAFRKILTLCLPVRFY